MIELIEYSDIQQIWSNHLWPGRLDIEPVSAMLYQTGYSMEHFKLPVFYFGIRHSGLLIGVNSGHMCSDNSFRSRGLWVDPNFRRLGYGIQLLESTIQQSRIMKSTFCWSLPRKSSWPTYQSVGFQKTSDWLSTDTSDANCYCRID